MADDVTDGQVGPAIRQRHHAVPVPAESLLGFCRLVQRAVLESDDVDLCDGLGHRMQHRRLRMLIGVDPSAHQCLTDHARGCRDIGELRGIQRLRIRPHQQQHTDGVTPRGQWPTDH